MRFVIWNLVDVDDVSPAMAPEIPFDSVLIFPSMAPESCKLMETILMARARIGVFLKEEGMMQHSEKVFTRLRNQGYRSRRRITQHPISSSCTQKANPRNQRKQGVVNPLAVRCKMETMMENCSKVFLGFWFNRSKNESE
jgi:hypothetical protein